MLHPATQVNIQSLKGYLIHLFLIQLFFMSKEEKDLYFCNMISLNCHVCRHSCLLAYWGEKLSNLVLPNFRWNLCSKEALSGSRKMLEMDWGDIGTWCPEKINAYLEISGRWVWTTCHFTMNTMKVSDHTSHKLSINACKIFLTSKGICWTSLFKCINGLHCHSNQGQNFATMGWVEP